MCGRTACTLDPDNIRRACVYTDKNGDKRRPNWRDDLSNGNYYPTYNLGPTKYAPMMTLQKHFDADAEIEDRVIIPVSWGFVVNFGKESESQRIINARTETVLEKSTFKTPLLAGKRCVILADGYYEWHRSDPKNKQPYFIHFPQPKGIEWYNQSWKEANDANEEWKVPRMLTMAGVFTTMRPYGAVEEQLGFVVLTVEAAETVSHIHDRMPAILDGEEAVREWLDYGNVKPNQAVSKLKPINNIEAYKVSPFVNNIRNDSPECIQPFKPPIEMKSGSQMFMQNWLKRSPSKQNEDSAKKFKGKKE